jgi:quercetin dioxygenase-like cupin family protein
VTTEHYRSGMAEEAVRFAPGDLAFFPPPVEHAVRGTPDGPGLLAVASIARPEFERYAESGL